MKYIPMGTSIGWAISKWSKHQKLAYEYISYLTSAAAEQTRLNVDGIGPTNPAVNVSKARIDIQWCYNFVKMHPVYRRGLYGPLMS